MHTQTRDFFSKRNLSILIVSILISVVFSQSVFATPAADLASLSQEQKDLDAELDTLMKDIRQVESDKETVAAQLDKAQSEVDDHYASMKERIRFMYEEGDTGMMNMLFSSKSMADFVNNAYYVSTISEYDRKMLQEYEAAKRAVEDKQEELAAKEKELKDLQADRLAKQEELAVKIQAAFAQMAAAQGASLPADTKVSSMGDGGFKITSSAGDFSWNGSVLTRLGGVNMGPNGKETYYNLNMNGVVQIMRSMGNNDQYWVRSDGAKMLGDYIIVAADLNTHPRGSIVDTSLGKGIVCDTGGFAKKNSNQIDIATTW